jgi:hypothetical protein
MEDVSQSHADQRKSAARPVSSLKLAKTKHVPGLSAPRTRNFEKQRNYGLVTSSTLEIIVCVISLHLLQF